MKSDVRFFSLPSGKRKGGGKGVWYTAGIRAANKQRGYVGMFNTYIYWLFSLPWEK